MTADNFVVALQEFAVGDDRRIPTNHFQSYSAKQRVVGSLYFSLIYCTTKTTYKLETIHVRRTTYVES